jgi:superfamily II DNA/RNA helicase
MISRGPCLVRRLCQHGRGRCFSAGPGGGGGASSSSFAQLALRPQLLDALSSLGLTEPTEVQTAAVPAVLSGRDVVIASETGSGKTLAYLLPVVHALKKEEEEAAAAAATVGARLGRPRCVVLVPSREVGRQVLAVVKSLAHHAKLASASLCDRPTPGQRARAVTTRPLDILVSTPGRLLAMLQPQPPWQGAAVGGRRGKQRRAAASGGAAAAHGAGGSGGEGALLHLTDVRFAIFDEADVLFDDGAQAVG